MLPHPCMPESPEQSPGLTLSPVKNSPVATPVRLQWVALPTPTLVLLSQPEGQLSLSQATQLGFRWGVGAKGR